MNFHLGYAMWAYEGWLKTLFSSNSRTTEFSTSLDFLHLYDRRFTAIEGKTTFYSISDADTVKRWAPETPDGFKFCLELPKSLTHNGLPKPTLSGTLAFMAPMRDLSDR